MDLNTEYIWLGIGFALIIAEVTMGIYSVFSRPCGGITGLALWLGLPAGNGPFILFAGLPWCCLLACVLA